MLVGKLYRSVTLHMLPSPEEASRTLLDESNRLSLAKVTKCAEHFKGNAGLNGYGKPCWQ